MAGAWPDAHPRDARPRSAHPRDAHPPSRPACDAPGGSRRAGARGSDGPASGRRGGRARSAGGRARRPVARVSAPKRSACGATRPSASSATRPRATTSSGSAKSTMAPRKSPQWAISVARGDRIASPGAGRMTEHGVADERLLRVDAGVGAVAPEVPPGSIAQQGHAGAQPSQVAGRLRDEEQRRRDGTVARADHGAARRDRRATTATLGPLREPAQHLRRAGALHVLPHHAPASPGARRGRTA